MSDFTEYGVPTEEWNRLSKTLPASNPDQTVAELKRTTNEGREDAARTQMKALAKQVTLENISITARDGYAIEARSYRPLSAAADALLPVYIHLHGGGFLFGTRDSEDAICSRAAINTPALVISVNYRHTPEAPYPTAWNDVEDAYRWICDNVSQLGGDMNQLVVGGISAGAWLTASLVRSLFASPSGLRPRGQVLMIPALVHASGYDAVLAQLKDPALSSRVQCMDAPILPLSRRRLFGDLLKIDPRPDDKRHSPGLLTPDEARQFPPTTLGIAGNDSLRDEGLLYGKLLADCGVPTSTHVFSGLPHGFRRFGDKLSASKDWDLVVEEGIRWALSNPETKPFSIQVH